MNSSELTAPDSGRPETRTTPGGRARWPVVASLLLAVVAGGLVGVLAKLADDVDVLGSSQITSTLGAWIVLVALVGFASSSTARAAGCSALLVLTAVLVYYVRQWQEFGYFPQQLAAAWCAFAVTGVPVLGAVCHQLRRRGWPAAVAVGLPVGLLLAEAVPRLLGAPVVQPHVVTDLVAAAALAAYGLTRGVGVLRLAAVVLVTAPVATAALHAVWSTVGGLG